MGIHEVSHRWVVTGHIHLDLEHELQLRAGVELELGSVAMCSPKVECLVCERDFDPREADLPCDGPPAGYDRRGEPMYARDN